MQPEWHFPYVSKDCIVFMLMNTGGEISKIIIIFSNDICSFPNVPTYFKYWEQTRKFNFLSLIHDLKKTKNKQTIEITFHTHFYNSNNFLSVILTSPTNWQMNRPDQYFHNH